MKVPPDLLYLVRTAAQEFLDDPNVGSVGIGCRIRAGVRTDELAVQFGVHAKMSARQLEVLSRRELPRVLERRGRTAPTDVIQTSPRPQEILPGEDEALANARRGRSRPLRPGASISSTGQSAGTLGCFVRDIENGQLLALTAAHVVVESLEPGSAVYQPGGWDDSSLSEANRVGTVARFHIGPAFDAAVVTIEDPADMTILGLDVSPIDYVEPELGQRVVKSGRTTGVTHGVVRRVHVTAKLQYRDGVEHSVGGFDVEPDAEFSSLEPVLSSAGDSGSIWMMCDPSGRVTSTAAGIHVAGELSAEREHAFVAYLGDLRQKLAAEFVNPAALDRAAETGRLTRIAELIEDLARRLDRLRWQG